MFPNKQPSTPPLIGPLLAMAAGTLLLYVGYRNRHSLPGLASAINSTLRDLIGPPADERRRGDEYIDQESEDVDFEAAMTILAGPDELYAQWRDFSNLPRLFGHVKSVTDIGDGKSHWVAEGPLGTVVEWDAEVTEDVPNERIAWKSLPGARIESSGSVEFDPAHADRGTVMRITANYALTGGVIGETVAHILGYDIEEQIREAMRKFKQTIEAGEAITVCGQPHAAA